MSIPSTQKALAILTKQGPWSIITVPVDTPGPGEVLVRVEATALNPVDHKVQSTGRYVTDYPGILGTDTAGVVVAVGEGVTNVAVGDRVVHQGYFTNRLASFKQFTISPVETVAKIPKKISFDQAASLPVGLGAAFVGLYGKQEDGGGADLVAPWKEGGRGKYANSPLVLFGGSTSVGQYVIQLAKLSGFSPIIATVSPRNYDLVKSLGATHTIDRSLPVEDIFSAVKAITSAPIKIVYDTVAAAPTQNLGYDLVSPGGALVLVLPSIVDETKITSDKVIVRTFGTVHIPLNKELGIGMYGALPKYLESGEIKPNNTEVIPGGLAAIPEGLERLKNNQVSAIKLIAHPQETK
ncbi:hypothetical protein EUX98_g2688 [Antrodiella citrinella]|uniref:Enoyl reductase (ER) domain-containing protein n=1 Tax=Antrodiella citrinella TaxID=2447956 RepID=A0A4S4MYF3_9APHY|nr:hypothetical protein EUX98_g2688 [Antrodiella citrinella]